MNKNLKIRPSMCQMVKNKSFDFLEYFEERVLTIFYSQLPSRVMVVENSKNISKLCKLCQVGKIV